MTPMRIAPLCLLVLAACVDGADTGDDAFAPDARAFDRPETLITSGPDELTNQVTARFEFSSDEPEATFTCATSGDEAVPCTSPYEVTLTDGEQTFDVAAADADGLTDPTPARHAWRIDTRAPQTRLVELPAPLDNSVNAYFELGSDEPGSTFACAVDDGAFEPCISPYRTPALTEGAHRFAAAATDPAGNLDPDPVTHTWTVDTSLPDTVIDSAPTGAVNLRTATITFSAPDAAAGSTFQCMRDSSLWAACTSPWQLSNLGDGPHTIQVRVVEPHLNVDPTPAIRSWTVDATAPVVAVTGGPDRRQTLTTPTFTFTTGDATAIECRVTGGTPAPDFAACTSPFTTAALPDGNHVFEVRGGDVAGNQTVATRSFGVDTIAPTITLTGPDGPVTDSTPSFGFSASESVTWRCKFDSGAYQVCSSPHEPPWGLTEGGHVFSLIARDTVGRETAVDRFFSVDRNTWVSITAGPGAQTHDSTPRFDFTISDAIDIRCRIDSGDLVACASPFTAPVLADGNHGFTVYVADQAGNTDSASRNFRVDTRPLAIAITGGPTGETQIRRPTFTWTTTGAIADVSCRYDAALFGDCGTAQAVDLPDGPHTFEVRITGSSGAVLSATRSFTVDTVAPGASFTDGPTGNTSATSVTFEFTTTGNPAVTECRLFREGQASGAYTACSSPHTITLTPPSAPFPYVFEVRVRDQAGNQWSAYRSFTYVAP